MKPIMGFQDEYRWLSNFWHSPITVIGIDYLNAEAAYQASKTTDISIREQFSKLNGSEAKRKGLTIKLRSDWEVVKIESMELCLRAKFMTHKPLAEKLIATGNRELIEFNTWGDTYWGKTQKGGRNILGKLLMNIREDLTK